MLPARELQRRGDPDVEHGGGQAVHGYPLSSHQCVGEGIATEVHGEVRGKLPCEAGLDYVDAGVDQRNPSGAVAPFSLNSVTRSDPSTLIVPYPPSDS